MQGRHALVSAGTGLLAVLALTGCSYDAQAGARTVSAVVAAPPAGQISGVVTDDDGRPAEGVQVTLHAPRGGGWRVDLLHVDSTDEQGRYTLVGVPSGTWRVGFNVNLHRHRASMNAPHVSEYYGDAATVEAGEDVVLAGGAGIDHVDARLTVGGSVSGVVTDESGRGLVDMEVLVTARPGTRLPEGWPDYQRTWTDHDGRWTAHGLAAGRYRVWVRDCGGLGKDPAVGSGWTGMGCEAEHAPRFYPGVERGRDSPPVTVGLGEETAGVDVVLPTL